MSSSPESVRFRTFANKEKHRIEQELLSAAGQAARTHVGSVRALFIFFVAGSYGRVVMEDDV